MTKLDVRNFAFAGGATAAIVAVTVFLISAILGGIRGMLGVTGQGASILGILFGLLLGLGLIFVYFYLVTGLFAYLYNRLLERK